MFIWYEPYNIKPLKLLTFICKILHSWRHSINVMECNLSAIWVSRQCKSCMFHAYWLGSGWNSCVNWELSIYCMIDLQNIHEFCSTHFQCATRWFALDLLLNTYFPFYREHLTHRLWNTSATVTCTEHGLKTHTCNPPSLPSKQTCMFHSVLNNK